MGLWGSKEPRSVTVKSPNDVAEVQLSEEALTNLVKTINAEKKAAKGDASSKRDAAAAAASQSVDGNGLRLLHDLHDKRIETYERNLVQNFDKSAKEVEAMFRDRYKTIPVCFDLQKSVEACYQENGSFPLKCSEAIGQYLKCVEQERKRLSSA